MRNAGLGETQAGIKIARRNIDNLRYADDTTLMAESEEELKNLLMKQWLTIFLGSKVMADGDCSHEIKRRLLLERKVMTNLDSILKSREITLPTKAHLIKAMIFPLVMYGCESWTLKKAECRKIDAFELWCWRRLLKTP